jgi:hypothetical protein
MEAALHLKFTQHLDLKAMLLGTGDAELIEVGSGYRIPVLSSSLTLLHSIGFPSRLLLGRRR